MSCLLNHGLHESVRDKRLVGSGLAVRQRVGSPWSSRGFPLNLEPLISLIARIAADIALQGQRVDSPPSADQDSNEPKREGNAGRHLRAVQHRPTVRDVD